MTIHKRRRQILSTYTEVIEEMAANRGITDKLHDPATWKELITEEAEFSIAASSGDEERHAAEQYAAQLSRVAAGICVVPGKVLLELSSDEANLLVDLMEHGLHDRSEYIEGGYALKDYGEAEVPTFQARVDAGNALLQRLVKSIGS